MRRFRRLLIGILITLLITFGGLELLLRIFDPWGMYYFDDVQTLFTAVEPHNLRGYVIRDGQYQLTHSTVTIQAGTRAVPDSNPSADCVIIMLGDSVTFGHGVSDGETFSNFLARRFTNAHFINSGTNAYNSTNILGTMNAFSEADGFVYTVIGNDALDPGIPRASGSQPVFMIARYWQYLGSAESYRIPETIPAAQLERFFTELDAILADPRLLLTGWNSSLSAEILARSYPLQLIPAYDAYPEYRISYVDGHPNAAGHQFIADQLVPFVEELIARQCAA